MSLTGDLNWAKYLGSRESAVERVLNAHPAVIPELKEAGCARLTQNVANCSGTYVHPEKLTISADSMLEVVPFSFYAKRQPSGELLVKVAHLDKETLSSAEVANTIAGVVNRIFIAHDLGPETGFELTLNLDTDSPYKVLVKAVPAPEVLKAKAEIAQKASANARSFSD